METEIRTDWIRRIQIASAEINTWLAVKSNQQWLDPVIGNWTVKDLIGHLSAWSNLLADQIEMLAQGEVEKIERIDIDHWNAAQIEARCNWSVPEVHQEWVQALDHIQTVIKRLSPKVFSGCWSVPWTEKPVGIGNLLELWLLHLEEHQIAWKPPTYRREQ